MHKHELHVVTGAPVRVEVHVRNATIGMFTEAKACRQS